VAAGCTVSPERVLDLLDELGESGQEVADTLFDLGVKGKRDNTGSCPIANYLRGEGVPDPVVNPDHVEWDSFEESITLPEGCIHFIARFDAGEFTDLLESP
jgi:hypothetical protein